MASRLLGAPRETDVAAPIFVHQFASAGGDVREATRRLSEALAGLDVDASCRSEVAVVVTELCENASLHGGRRARIELRVAPSIIVVDVVDDGAWAGRAGHVFGGDDVPSRGRGLTRALELCEEVRIACLVGETRVSCTFRNRESRRSQPLRSHAEARS